MKCLNYFFFGGGAYGDFSDIKSSIRNRMDDYEIFFDCNIFLSENAAIPVGQLA